MKLMALAAVLLARATAQDPFTIQERRGRRWNGIPQ
jgi:hypothetical protein